MNDVKRVFLDLVELSQAERKTRLAALRCEDSGVAREVEALLSAMESPGGPRLEIPGEHRRLGQIASTAVLDQIEVAHEVEGVLGIGDQSIVLSARLADSGRPVALKIETTPGLTAFKCDHVLYEAALLQGLRHLSIANVAASGRAETADGERPYVATELINGLALEDHAREHALSEEQRLRLLVSCGEGLLHAHTAGVLHRDVRSANILVDESGQPKLVEFAFSATVEAPEERSFEHLSHSAPELLDGTPANIATDIHAFGVVAYRLLCGRHPWDDSGLTRQNARRRLRYAARVPLSRVSQTCDRHLAAVIDRAVHHDPKQRFGSMDELVAELRRVLRGEPTQTRARKSWRLFR